MLKELFREKKSGELLIVIIIFAFIIGFAIYLGIKAGKSTNEEYEEKTISIKDRFDLIEGNYSFVVTKTSNGEDSVLKIDCDDGICMYSSDLIPTRDIIRYNGKWYTVADISNLYDSELIQTDDSIVKKNFNEKYYNLDLISSIIEVSNKESNENGNIKVNVSLERYLKEYNYIYSTINKTEEDVSIPIEISISDTMIRKIKIDYKLIDKYFNKSSYNELTYTIDLKSVNANDFSAVLTYFEKVNGD